MPAPCGGDGRLVLPVLIGAGKTAFPIDAHVRLELQEERRFDNGTIYLRYSTKT